MLVSLLLLYVSDVVYSTSPPISMPFRIQGTVIYPNGTSVYADHELPSKPGKINETLLFRGLFHLAGNIPMGPIVLGDSEEKEAIRGSVLFPDGRRIRAFRKILQTVEEQDEHYLRKGNIGAHVFTISEEEKLRLAGSRNGVKVNIENSKSNVNGNSYYLEKERLGAFVYSEGLLEGTQSDSSLTIEDTCRFSFSKPQGQRGQFWLLRSKPCGNLFRLTTQLPDGTNIHFYGVPVLVDL